MPPDIFVIDDQAPEDLAMLQALYSRSPASVVTHLEKLKKSGSGKFMSQYYVGYGHASIGDCGSTTVFVEQVSMLVAKALQDTPLYNGQEASTRYLDFSQQAIVDPYGTPESAALQAEWKRLYEATLPKLFEALKNRHPFDPAAYKSEKIWLNTLQARAFDIARSLLPLGTTTLLSWTTSLRHARDHLRRLKHHPLPEVRDVARGLFEKLTARYPNSFTGQEMEAADTRDAYAEKFADANHFAAADDLIARFQVTAEEQQALLDGAVLARRDALDLEGLRRSEAETLATRPNGAALPWRLEAYGSYNFLFLLDFGSFRDIQRHRNGVCQIPLVDGRFGLHPWYQAQMDSLLPSDDAAALRQALQSQYRKIAPLGGATKNAALDAYYFPMGTSALVHVAYSVPETVYVGELRSGKTVHPSLRPVAQRMLQTLQADLPAIALHGDMETEDWTAKRGEQTITAKAS